MKIIGICGSPRKGGNTEIALDKALEGARSKGAETEKIVINSFNFVPCQECAAVKDDGTCKIEDDFQIIYNKIKDADGVIVSTPIFFGSVSAQAKMMIDRFQCLWRARFMLKKKVFANKKRGAFIAVAASTREDFFKNARSIIRNLFLTIGADYKEELFIPGVDEKGKVSEHPDSLREVFLLGRRLAS